MKIPKIVIVAGIVVVIAVVVLVVGLGFVALDGMSTFASGSEKLTPAGNTTGKALVVYNPGVTGAAKDAAAKIANDLKSRGYAVDLAGVKSATAASASGYDVIVVGGPVYAGNASGSIKSYLSSLSPPPGAKVGVFATGGYSTTDSVRNEVTGLPAGTPYPIKAVMKIYQGDDVARKCADFVAELLQ